MIKNAEWRTSSYSGEGINNCVECAVQTAATSIRDSKAPIAGMLVVRRAAWDAFLGAIKDGHGDDE